MRKIIKGAYYFLSIIIAVLAVAFCVIEGRLLLSGDWLLYEFAMLGALRYLCRLLMAVVALIVGILPFVAIKKRSIGVANAQRAGTMMLLCMSVVLLLFGTNYVGVVLFAFASAHFVLNKAVFMKS